MLGFLALTCISFSLFGFIIGIWAKNFEQLQLVPLLIVSPLVFLGGAFYSITMLPPVWQKVTLFNPVVYLISGFRWSFFDTADVGVGLSLAAIAALHPGLPGDRLVDLPHRLPDQELTARIARRPTPPASGPASPTLDSSASRRCDSSALGLESPASSR